MTFVVHCLPAIDAGNAAPAAQRHIGTAFVVGFEDLIHEEEKVQQAPGGQGCFDGRGTIPFAENVLANMRVSDLLVQLRTVRRQRPGIVSTGQANPLPVKSDLEGAQMQILEPDRPGDDGHGSLPQINGHLTEFIAQRHQIAGDISVSRHGWLATGRRHHRLVFRQLARQSADAGG